MAGAYQLAFVAVLVCLIAANKRDSAAQMSDIPAFTVGNPVNGLLPISLPVGSSQARPICKIGQPGLDLQLCAQPVAPDDASVASKWVSRAFWLSVAGAFIGALMLILADAITRRIAKKARQDAAAAELAALATRQLGEAQISARLEISEVLCEIRGSQLALAIVVENVGQSSALRVVWSAQIMFQDSAEDIQSAVLKKTENNSTVDTSMVMIPAKEQKVSDSIRVPIKTEAHSLSIDIVITLRHVSVFGHSVVQTIFGSAVVVGSSKPARLLEGVKIQPVLVKASNDTIWNEVPA